MTFFSCQNQFVQGTARVSIVLDGTTLSKDASAKGAMPASLESFTLTVTASGMETITKTYTRSEVASGISLEITAGPARLFTMTSAVPASASASTSVKAYTGASGNIDLTAGQSVAVSIPMRVSETKIVIPDYLNNRILQMDDMSGTNLVARTLPMDSYDYYMSPFDVDFDATGRIYVSFDRGKSNEELPTQYPERIVRFDTISATAEYTTIVNYTDFYTSPQAPVRAIAIDRNASPNVLYFYYKDSTSATPYLCKKVLDTAGATVEQTAIATLGNYSVKSVNGMTVSEEGTIYLAANVNDPLHEYSTGYPAVIKIGSFSNPASSFSVSAFDLFAAETEELWDILAKGNYLAVSVNKGRSDGSFYNGYSGYDGYGGKVVQLDIVSLQKVAEGGGTTGEEEPPLPAGKFYQPRQFLAPLNTSSYVIDEGGYYPPGENINRIIRFESATNWSMYDFQGMENMPFFYYEWGW